MTITLDELEDLTGRELPGDRLTIEPYEARIADHALLADGLESAGDPAAHPLWYVILSLRGMGITVDELCEMAGMREGDTLLLGECEIDQRAPLLAGTTYRTTAEVTRVGRRATRDGAMLDSVEIVVRFLDDTGELGSVTSIYLFRRGGA